MSNRLKDEKSPYLVQHKDNAVDWYPWGGEAFRKAAREDKPVFLSIGYSTCHWCHVMAHESFEDTEVAQLLRDFVCIKVDREERPDIDAVYMAVCQMLTGSGGWPLTVLMTPDQKPFFAGTYFPKTSRGGQIGMMELLPQIAKLWKGQREKLVESGEEITAMLGQSQMKDGGMPQQGLLQRAYTQLQQSFDEKWGGFGRAPKFPTPHNLLFLMRMYEDGECAGALDMAETTLRAMAQGGIFDHIGGGFSRYSTDEKWLVPHFEKMLYDNALLLLAYVEAFQLTKNPFYEEIARRTADYLLEELSSPEGGFYCGQDADSEGVEGKYYVFTPQEIICVLGKEEGEAFCRRYHITEAGNFEGKSIPNRIGDKMDAGEIRNMHFKRLWAYRKERTHLCLDYKILLSWNAWTIMALARAGLVLEDKRYTDSAIKAQSFIREKMTDKENRLYLRYCNGEAAHEGQLEDYAVYTLALTELYRVTFDPSYLQEAVFRGKQIIDFFEDKENGGCYMTAHHSEKLISRPKESYDGAIPSGNSVVAMALETLSAYTGEPVFGEAALRQFRFMAGQAGDLPSAHCFALCAMAPLVYSQKELLFTGEAVPHELKEYLRAHPAHNLRILFKSADNEEQLSQIAPFTKSYPLSKETVWYLCENGTCHAPVKDFLDLLCAF